MYKALNPWAVGVKINTIEEGIAAAVNGEFDGLELSISSVADLIDEKGAVYVRSLFESAKIVPAGFGLTVDFRTSEEHFERGLKELPRFAKAASSIGCTRTATWITPCSDTLTFEENRKFHVLRFTPIAEILQQEGILLGLEFIGPQTLWQSKKYPFIHQMEPMLEMGRDIGLNVGLLLDCWHWHTSEGTLASLLALEPSQIAYVHVNDAPIGVNMEEYQDHVRGMPGETGVIDIKGFLQSLQTIGYEGPVVAEPFKTELNDLPTDNDRISAVSESMKKIFAIAGI